MPPRERVDFTHRELESLSNLLANTADFPEWLEESFPNMDRVEKAALARASEKVGRAHRKARTGNAADPDVFCNRCDNRGKNTPGPGGQNFGCPGCGYTLGGHPNGLRRQA